MVQATSVIFRYGGTDVGWQSLVCLAELLDKHAWESSDVVECCLATTKVLQSLVEWWKRRMMGASSLLEVPDEASFQLRR
jgi:hypothetical protein